MLGKPQRIAQERGREGAVCGVPNLDMMFLKIQKHHVKFNRYMIMCHLDIHDLFVKFKSFRKLISQFENGCC